MSFNQTIFNRGIFNLSESANAQWLDIEAYENVNAITSVSKDIYLLCIPHEGVGMRVHGERFKSLDVTAHEVLGYNVALEGTFWKDVQCDEWVYTEAVICSIYSPTVEGHEESDNEAWVCSENRIKAVGAETVDAESYGCREWHPDVEGNELVSQVASGIYVEEIACLLNLTLNPGERLIVDAGNYNVYILDQYNNMTNMIHTQQGEWLDELTRDALSVSITAAAGGANLSASILYTERWL